MKALHLVRHGETDWNLEKRIQGSRDLPLNDNGRHQAVELAEALAARGWARIRLYTSPQTRARETAAILAGRLGSEPVVVDGLQEINLGRWEGLTWDEVKATDPVEFEAWFQGRRLTRPPGGESYQDVLDRVLEALAGLTAQGDGEVVVVTHGGVLLALGCLLAGTPFEDMDRHKVGNTGIVTVTGEQWARLARKALG